MGVFGKESVWMASKKPGGEHDALEGPCKAEASEPQLRLSIKMVHSGAG